MSLLPKRTLPACPPGVAFEPDRLTNREVATVLADFAEEKRLEAVRALPGGDAESKAHEEAPVKRLADLIEPALRHAFTRVRRTVARVRWEWLRLHREWED